MNRLDFLIGLLCFFVSSPGRILHLSSDFFLFFELCSNFLNLRFQVSYRRLSIFISAGNELLEVLLRVWWHTGNLRRLSLELVPIDLLLKTHALLLVFLYLILELCDFGVILLTFIFPSLPLFDDCWLDLVCLRLCLLGPLRHFLVASFVTLDLAFTLAQCKL